MQNDGKTMQTMCSKNTCFERTARDYFFEESGLPFGKSKKKRCLVHSNSKYMNQ